MPRTAPRTDWRSLRDQIDLASVASCLLGPPPGRRGERGRRLWWPCPIHEDQNPSFAVDPGKAFWKCYGCNERGDAANLVMHLRSCTFSEALEWLVAFAGASALPIGAGAAAPPTRRPSLKAARPDGPEGMTADEAERLVTEAVDRLWSPEGADALGYLRSRGLTDEPIRSARLGYAPEVRATTRDGRHYSASGITVPWQEQNRLTLIKVRQSQDRRPKYAEVYRHNPSLYIAAPILPGRPAIVTEGELDALIVAQQTAHLACGVVTTGSASNRPDPSVVSRLLAAPRWVVAVDADPAGDQLAGIWEELSSGRCKRVRPPGPGKDWTDCHEGGPGRIAYHLAPLVMTPPSWEELSTLRWSEPSDEDEPSGLLADS